jgi:hypothetical protein
MPKPHKKNAIFAKVGLGATDPSTTDRQSTPGFPFSMQR